MPIVIEYVALFTNMQANMSHWLAVQTIVILLSVQDTLGVHSYLREGIEVDRDPKSSILLGGLFPVHHFTEHGRINCGNETKFNARAFQSAAAMVYAIEIINNNTNKLPGIELVYDITDTCRSSITSLESSLGFLPVQASGSMCAINSSLSVSAVVGPATSTNSRETQNLLRLFQIPQVSFASTSDELSNKKLYDYFFRTIPPDSYQANAIFSITEHFNWSFVSIAYSGNNYGRNGIMSFKELFLGKNNTNCIAGDFEIPSGASADAYEKFASQLLEKWQSNSSVLVFFGSSSEAHNTIDALIKKGIKSLTWIASDGVGTNVDPSRRQHVLGQIGVQPDFTEYDRKFQDWFTEFVARTEYENHTWFKEFKFNMECNNNCTLDTTDYSAAFTMDAVYALGNSLHNMQQTLCGNSSSETVYSGICPEILDGTTLSRINGSLFREYLRNVTDSNNDRLFNDNQDRVGDYIIYNLMEKEMMQFNYIPVGKWFSSFGNKTLMLNDTIKWNNQSIGNPGSFCSKPCQTGFSTRHIPNFACCWECIPCGIGEYSSGDSCRLCDVLEKPSEDGSTCVKLPLNFIDWNNGWAIGIMCISILGIAVTTVSTVVFIIFFRKYQIKAGNRFMSFVILLGCFLSFVLPFFYLGRPHPVTCAIRRIGIGICFSICFGAILVKIQRIYRIVNNIVKGKSIKPPRFVGWKSQVCLIVLIVLIQIVIGAIWLGAEQPKVVTHSNIQFESAELRCAANPLIGLSVTLGYNILLLLISLVFSLLMAKEIPKEYNETRFIQVAVLILCVMWIAIVPSYYSTFSISDVYITIIQVIAVTLTASIMLIFFILHKVYTVIFPEKEETFLRTHTPSHQHPDMNRLKLGNKEKYSVDSKVNSHSSTDTPSNKQNLSQHTTGHLTTKEGKDGSSDQANGNSKKETKKTEVKDSAFSLSNGDEEDRNNRSKSPI